MKPSSVRSALLALALAGAFALAACGDDSSTSTEAEESASTPEVALTEIGETQKGLAAATDTYASGDATAASDQVQETYLQHFELVEGPLEEVDPELTEQLEEQIREELVASIEAGDPVPEVKALVKEIDAGLEDASAQLEAA